MSARPRLAVVVSRYAPTTFGGAERHAFALARALQRSFDVELLTTTATDYMTWANALAPGVETIDGLTVRRFRVDVERNVARFDALSKALLRRREPPLAEQERWMGMQGPLSLELLDYLADHRTAYEAFVFVGYLYATTYFGLPLVADRAVLLPLAHDEWPIRFSMWDRIFALPRAFVYNTSEERAFVAGRFPSAPTDGPVLGVGIDAPAGADAERFRRRFGITRPFALYLGRLDPSKGVRELVRAFGRARQTRRDLVLVGESQMTIPERPGLHVTGPLDEQTKWDALAACDLVVVPSRYESLSLAALEAWAVGKPVLANARAAAMAGQIARSRGGLTYTTDRDFARALTTLDPATAIVTGARGQAYVDTHYRWPIIEANFTEHLRTTFAWP